MKIGLCNEMFENWPIQEIFHFAARLGYQGVEIAPFTLASSVEEISFARRREIRHQAEEAHIRIIGTHWLLVKPEGLSLSSPDFSVRSKTADYLRKLVIFTAEIGGEIMVLGSPKQRSLNPGQNLKEVSLYVAETLQPALDQAAKEGIVICLEPLSRKETNFINTAQQAIDFIQKVKHPYLRLILDVKAMSDEEKPVPEIIHSCADWLRHVHFNDTNLLGPGWGETDFQPILKALQDINYRHWVSIEVFDFSPGPEEIARKSMDYLKEILYHLT